MGRKTYETNEQLKAAYALNMCTVSVSQIVDYNDEYILEQEYEAILNNLNLEQMPKDEALLNILVKLLNVITFFRIEKVKKEQIDKKYQTRMKNAIWSAVSNIGVIVANNPVNLGISLATQIGIGYMNYRREKANALLEKEDAEVELRITAMEQFNALRRELFTTAWRLADEYNFPDRYRLTERQIEQYNKILMDTDEIRKYERLESVKDSFEAYLPFWYFMGHSAKYIAEDITNGLEEQEREYYRVKAKQHFEQYDKLNTFNILREDELTASFALEYIDLLLLEEKPDMDIVNRLLSTAVKMAGNANDILQLCSIAYIKIGQTQEAESILRILINEGYNTSTNAKLLSRIYVSSYLKGTDPHAKTQYKFLERKVPQSWLFPMPERQGTDKGLLEDFITNQRNELQKEYEDVLTQYIEKYIVLFNRVIPVPSKEDKDELFINTDEALAKRIETVRNALEHDKDNKYKTEIKESGFRFRYIELLNEMLNSLDSLSVFRDSEKKDQMIALLKGDIALKSRNLKQMQDKLDTDTFMFSDYEKLQKDLSLEMITKEFFEFLMSDTKSKIDNVISLDELDLLESDLILFCDEQNLENNINNKSNDKPFSNNFYYYISTDILGKNEHDENMSQNRAQKMIDVVREAADSIVDRSGNIELIVKGDLKFDTYFKNTKLHGEVYQTEAIAIINDLSSSNTDLIITTEGVVLVNHNLAHNLREFDKIEYAGSKINLGWPLAYSNKAVKMDELFSLIEKLSKQ